MDFDNGKSMKAFVRPAAGARIAAAAVWVLALALFAAAAAAGSRDEGDPALFRPFDSEEGSYVYLDIVGVSDWVFRSGSDTYYMVLDGDGRAYCARLTDAQFGGLGEYNRYWNEVIGTAPAPYRLSGLCSGIWPDMRTSMAGAWDMEEDEFTDWFGDRYLDATTSPGEQAQAMWLVFGFFALLAGVILAAVTVPAQTAERRCLKRLEQTDRLDAAAADFGAASGPETPSGPVLLGRSFLFVRRGGAIVPYSDILWCYKRVTHTNFFITMETAVVCTADRRTWSLGGARSRLSTADSVLAALAERCPNARFGFSKENRAWYKETVKGAGDR